MSDNALGWVSAAFALVAAIILDKNSPPHKWHAAIMWSIVALFGILIWGRDKQNSRLFWTFWVGCVLLQISTMWVIFGKLLPRLVLGTVYVVPLAFIESLLLFVAFLKLERKIAQHTVA